MNRLVLFVVSLNCFQIYHVHSANLPGPLVYVVTPSSRSPQVDTGRSAPFYYHKWISRMDTPRNVTSSTTTSTAKTKTPDLIFAEFESDNENMKSIRKLLEKEKIKSKTTTTTLKPIYVSDEQEDDQFDYGLPKPTTEKPKQSDMTDYFALYNNLYNSGPVYVPPISTPPAPPTTTTSTTTTTQAPIHNVENIWHIIDSEKHDQYPGDWQEEPVSSEQSTKDYSNMDKTQLHEIQSNEEKTKVNGEFDENFALPGFVTNPGNGAENESRAIRTDPNIRFPYIDLKTFQMKNLKKSQFNSISSGKKDNMFNLDSFTEIKNPVRGEVQDTVIPRQPVDRYNPAQPYLPPSPVYGQKSKQSVSSIPSIPSAPSAPFAPPSRPMNTVANLVPPPPPPPSKVSADDLPSPTTYESFPPYDSVAPAPSPPNSMFQTIADSAPDSPDDDNDGPPTDIGYRYKPPSPPSLPSLPFVPTIPPPSKPFMGYSYNKPSMPQDDDTPPMRDMGGKPDIQSYHYSKPAPPPPPPSPTQDYAPSYGHHDQQSPTYQPEPDYPDLIFDKPPHGNVKDGDGMKGGDMGMMPPPPPPADMKPDMDSHGAPMDDHGFPHDFPGDFKFHHDFDEHEHDHYHYHHPTTTTTTTEMPRVNRYSYYYLGKKLYYLPLYFSVYFIVYVGALIIKAVLRHKITYPNSYRPNSTTASFFSKRSIESHLSNENLHEITGRVTRAIATAAEKYISDKSKHS